MSQERTSAAAIWSFVLGILSLCCLGPLAAIPAIICGHISKAAIRRSGGALTGGGMATAGLVLGYLSLLFFIIFAVIFILLAPATQPLRDLVSEHILRPTRTGQQVSTQTPPQPHMPPALLSQWTSQDLCGKYEFTITDWRGPGTQGVSMRGTLELNVHLSDTGQIGGIFTSTICESDNMRPATFTGAVRGWTLGNRMILLLHAEDDTMSFDVLLKQGIMEGYADDLSPSSIGADLTQILSVLADYGRRGERDGKLIMRKVQ